jgi:FkbM family methyltransferase
VTGGHALSVLGTAARFARRVGLEEPLRATVDSVDGLFVRAGVPPLGVDLGTIKLRGYLRHRGFLEYLARGMPEEGYYRSLVVDAVDSQTTFVDAGAHIGVYTLLTCGRARRVVAFEPDPYNLAALHRNVSRCGCRNVEIHSAAVADRWGHAQFRAFRSTFSGSLMARNVDEYEEFQTPVVRLDDILDKTSLRRLVLKLDVEGAEPLVLAGARKTMARVPLLTVFVEINPDALEAGGSSAAALVQCLLASDLECSTISEEKRALIPLRGRPPLGRNNLICRKRLGDATSLD